MDKQTFITLHALSRRLGLPAAWLKAEAEAGRIPSLRTGRRFMFSLEAVERILFDRARVNALDPPMAQKEEEAGEGVRHDG